MKMYVLVRNDLSKSQQAVQAGHALAQFMLEHPQSDWRNETLIYLKVPKDKLHEHLSEWKSKLKEISSFNEPDLNNELTAFAFTEPTPEVKEMKLL